MIIRPKDEKNAPSKDGYPFLSDYYLLVYSAVSWMRCVLVRFPLFLDFSSFSFSIDESMLILET